MKLSAEWVEFLRELAEGLTVVAGFFLYALAWLVMMDLMQRPLFRLALSATFAGIILYALASATVRAIRRKRGSGP